jgi:hypothetical protein
LAGPKGHIRGMAKKLAEQGWFVRVETVGVAFQPAVMYFAVGKNSSQEAMAAVLDHPQWACGTDRDSRLCRALAPIGRHTLSPRIRRTPATLSGPAIGLPRGSLIVAELLTGKRVSRGAYFGHGDNCSMQLRRRVQTEEKFLVPHTGDAVCTVCGAALESWWNSAHVPTYELIERPERKSE